jgi:hypothetical protein
MLEADAANETCETCSTCSTGCVCRFIAPTGDPAGLGSLDMAEGATMFGATDLS